MFKNCPIWHRSKTERMKYDLPTIFNEASTDNDVTEMRKNHLSARTKKKVQ